MKDIQKTKRAHEENQHFRYIEAETYIGTLAGLLTRITRLKWRLQGKI